MNVYCDPNKLDAYNLSVETISSIISAENRNTPGGTFDVGNNTYSLRVEGEFKDPKEMENIVVGTHNGASVYLRDVATVVDSVEERAQKTYSNGVQGAMIVVQKQSGANSVAISQKVIDMLPQLQKSLPSDVKLGIIVNTSDNILNTIDSLEETIMYAMLFVILVVFVFLGRWRATVIICITIPMSLVASFIYLGIIDGGSLNIISLSCLSIAIGNVVDDAIVVLENVTTHIERGSEPKQAAVHATNERITVFRLKPRSINEHKLSRLRCYNAQHPIAGRLRFLGSDTDFLTDHGVDQRTFTHIRATDHGNITAAKILFNHDFCLRVFWL